MSDLENRYVADVIADYKKGLTIPRANCDVPMLLDEIERLTDLLHDRYVPGYLEGKNERLQAKVEQLEGAARKTLKEQDEADEHHSSACMNWTFCEHSQHQCGLCDLRAALGGDDE